MHRYPPSPPPSSVRMVDGQRRDFQCPEEDTQGSPLTVQVISIADNGSGTTVTCTYDQGAGDCTYLEGSFLSGSAACPDSSPLGTISISTPSIISFTLAQAPTQITSTTQTPSSSKTLAIPTPNSLPPTSALPSTPDSQLPASSLLPSSVSQSRFSSHPLSSFATFQPMSSATSASVPISSTTNSSLPVGGQTGLRSRNNALPASAIAGIVVSIATVLVLAVILALHMRRARKRHHSATAPEPYLTNEREKPTPSDSEATSAAPVYSESPAPISTVTQDLQGLERAIQQNEALRERIRILERETQSQQRLGLMSESPPAY
ncbi:hypothetical protein B0H12DRAFT_1145001, partial [Mycena haematopus]